MTYTALEDGSVLYDKPIPLNSSLWIVDPENPCRYIPQVSPCGSRRIELRTLECGKKRATWHCGYYFKTVSVKDCKECPVPTNR